MRLCFFILEMPYCPSGDQKLKIRSCENKKREPRTRNARPGSRRDVTDYSTNDRRETASINRKSPVREMRVEALDWSGKRGSNPRHSAWEADALPLNYSRIFNFNSILSQPRGKININKKTPTRDLSISGGFCVKI